MGPHLGNNLLNLGIHDEVRHAIGELGLDFDELLAQEDEPGLGNGGLGRLAACFIDSLATLEIPALGYGIRYEFGIFQQDIADGWQVERTDKWLRYGNPWEIARPEWAQQVKFGGHTEHSVDEQGRRTVRWVPGKVVNGMPYDTPILGYGINTANTLRLWKAEAPESFDFSTFNRGDYYGAVQQKIASENLSKVLYPNDEQVQGKELRLEQQYFFVACSLQRHAAYSRDPEDSARELPPTSSPCSSTTRIRRSRSRSSCGCWSTSTALGWDRCLGHHAADLRLHQPHAAAGSAGAMAARTVRQHAAAPPGDHLRDQRALPGRSAPEVSRRRGAHRAAVADRRARRALRAHGQPGLRRHACDQRRRRAALRAAEAGRVARLPRAVAGEVQQQDQRRDAATLADAGESAAGASDHAHGSAWLDARTSRSCAGWSGSSTMRISAPRGATSSTRTRSPSRATCSRNWA